MTASQTKLAYKFYEFYIKFRPRSTRTPPCVSVHSICSLISNLLIAHAGRLISRDGCISCVVHIEMLHPAAHRKKLVRLFGEHPQRPSKCTPSVRLHIERLFNRYPRVIHPFHCSNSWHVMGMCEITV